MKTIQTLAQLDDALSDPPDYVIEVVRQLRGDFVVLGVGGKMGPTLARMIRRAIQAAGTSQKVFGVARFSSPDLPEQLSAWGIEPIKADLLDRAQLGQLPDAANVIYMAGMKFGSTGNQSLTWAMNTHLPSLVCERYRGSRIAAFSTGNVYGLAPAVSGGSIERDPLRPVGEYAMSCLGRERIFEHFAKTTDTPVAIIRLNYACELRYGVLVDLARKIIDGAEIDLAMGAFNVIWQRDANANSIAALAHAASPAFALNVAGPEILSVKRVCEQLGAIMQITPKFVGFESPDALLNNAQLSHRLFGYPDVTAGQMIDQVANWTQNVGQFLDKPTHFEARDGKY